MKMWTVRRPEGMDETIEADYFEIMPSGVLVFYRHLPPNDLRSPQTCLAISPQWWRSVMELDS